MSRYIDAEPLDKEISSWITDDRGGNLDHSDIVFNETLVDCLEAISKQPTADVVPVIRCKDCKYGEIDDPDFPDQYLCLYHGCDWNPGDHFCSYGEKVTE